MRIALYERTAYLLSPQPVPSCFIHLEEHFNRRFPSAQEAAAQQAVLLAEGICARMADVEMYAFLMEDVRKRHTIERREDDKAAVLTRAYMFGYLAVCAGLLDLVAQALVTVHDLSIETGARTFRSAEYWHQMLLNAPTVHRRYHPMRLFFQEVYRWVDEATVRLPPLGVLLHHYGQFPSRDALLRVASDRLLELDRMALEPFRVLWVDPLDLHSRWKLQLLALCEKICVDIEKHT
jgi:hypothetical protein